MGEQPRTRLAITKFQGLITNEDSHDLSPGQMQVQRNLQILSPGKLQVRGGCRPVNFENAISPTTNAVQSIAYFRLREADLIVYQDVAGNVKAGRNPS